MITLLSINCNMLSKKPTVAMVTSMLLISVGLYFISLQNTVGENLIIENDDGTYKPIWASLDSRPLPQWYDDAKFGIFIHWGVFSVPSFGSEWFWKQWKEEKGEGKFKTFMKQRYPPGFTYQEFAHSFTAEFFNATKWSELFKAAGAKYVVLTSKHHDGYTLWPSKYSFSWNAMDVGPHRDLIGELADAIRKNTNITFGLYHSLFEWYNPLWVADKKDNFATSDFVNSKVYPEMVELIEKYKPEVLWSDGEWDAPDTYWRSKEFLAWLFNESPVNKTVVVNDRWGHETLCHHGSFYTCQDRYNPGILQSHKWENAMTIDKSSWGFRRNADLSDYLSTAELVKELVITVSCGGNLLMNVGPTKDGLITAIFEERLRAIGQWLNINGEAIYESTPWKYQNDTITGDTWYTTTKNKKTVYAIVLTWPKENILLLGAINLKKPYLSLLGFDGFLKPIPSAKGLKIMLPVAAHRDQPAWVIKITQKNGNMTKDQ